MAACLLLYYWLTCYLPPSAQQQLVVDALLPDFVLDHEQALTVLQACARALARACWRRAGAGAAAAAHVPWTPRVPPRPPPVRLRRAPAGEVA